MPQILPKRTKTIVGCADRKSSPVADDLRLRNYAGSLANRTSSWIDRINFSQGPTIPARDLYRGEHWSSVRTFADRAGEDVEFWIASAGYGLTNFDEPLEPYGATFAPRHLDTVSPNALDLAAWWSALSKRCRPEGQHRTIEAMAAADPEDGILIAVSPSYLKAMTPDLVAAAHQLADPDLMTILTTGQVSRELIHHAVFFDDRMMSVVGGSLNAIYPRSLLHLFGKNVSAMNSTKRVRELMDEVLGNAQRPMRIRHETLSDEEVVGFLIQSWDQLDKPPTRSAALRDLRGSGRACEQNRFISLYERAREDVER